MKRIKNADINFKVNPKRINLNNFSMKFYTVNSEAYFFTKDQNNLVSVERDATIYDEDVIISGGTKVLDYYLPLDWSELVQLGEGVLNYRCINNIEDPFFPDMAYNQVVEDTTGYYIDSDIIVDPSQNRNIIERVTELESGLAVESIDREEADTFISGAVDTEVARAISAETELSERIDELTSGTTEALDDEIARAEAAEAALQDAIDAEEARAIAIENAIRQDLTDESEIRSSADTAIWTAINDEIVRSTSAETALDNKIDVENLRAIGVENAISGNLETYKATNNAALQAETTRATSAETSLGNAIEDEVTARENADAALGTRIDNLTSASTAAIEAEENRAKAVESGLTTALNSEVSRATSAETIIANSLNTEITRATSAETALNNQIDAEVLRATAAEAELEAKIGLVSGATELINAETARAVTVENALSGAIDSVSAATSGSVEELDAKIDTVSGNVITETTRATNAENALGGRIDAEEARAKGVEDVLSGAIDTLDVRFFDDAKYEDSGNTKVINFYNGNVVKATIDCTDFLVDGMIDDVYIENGYLVIDFNTASGKQDIRIPLTDIFNPANYYTKSETSGATEIANALALKLNISDFNTYSGAVDTLINSKAAQTIVDALSGTVTGHTSDSVIHVTSSDKEKWNKVDDKADTTALTAVNAVLTAHTADTSIHLTSGNVQTQIDNSISGKTNQSDFTAHTSDTTIHVTTAQTAAWSAKQNALTAGSGISIVSDVISVTGGGITSGEVQSMIESATTPISQTIEDNEEVTAQALNVLNGELANKLDVSAYTPVDLSNYYTKSETSGATEISTALAQKLAVSDFNTYSGAVDTVLSGKQDTLVSGTNIKTINNESILGSGNITIQGGGGEVSSAITSGDTNAVAGGAVFDAVVYSGNTYTTELTFDANGYAENWIVGQSAITIDVSGYTSSTSADYIFENSNGENLGIAHIHKDITTWWSSWNNDANNCTITTDGDTATTATITDIPSGTVKIRRMGESNPPKAIISGDTPEIWIKDALDDHRDNTTIHITNAERSSWNNKSNFSGSYNDLTDKPIPDSALNKYSDNPLKNSALFDELRIASGDTGTTDLTITFDGGNSTNYPTDCRQIKVELVNSANGRLIFRDSEGYDVGDYYFETWGTPRITNNLAGSTYELSGSTVIISYPNVSDIARLNNDYGTQVISSVAAVMPNYTYVPVVDQVVANTTALASKQTILTAGTGIDITANVISVTGGTGGGISSAECQTMIDQSISGKTNQSDFTGHTTNTSIHVTTAQTAAWDAKSDFSGSYNDLTDKPTIPTVPTSNTAFTNDAGYITANDITGKTDVTAFTAHTANTTVHTTAAEKTSWNGAVTALGGLKLVKLSQSAYDNLQTKDNNTLYVIVG